MRESCPWWCREILVEAGKTSCFAFRDLTHANGSGSVSGVDSGSVCKSVNHEVTKVHEGKRLKLRPSWYFVFLVVNGFAGCPVKLTHDPGHSITCIAGRHCVKYKLLDRDNRDNKTNSINV
jgi:hypothetical protein